MEGRFTARRSLFDVETARSMALDAGTILGNQFDRTVIAGMPNELFYPTNSNGSGLVSYFEDPQRSPASGVLLMKFNPEATGLKQCSVMSNCAEHHFQELLPTVINQILRYQQSGDINNQANPSFRMYIIYRPPSASTSRPSFPEVLRQQRRRRKESPSAEMEAQQLCC